MNPIAADPGALSSLQDSLAAADPAAGAPPEAGLVQARRAADLAATLERPHDVARAQAWACTHLLRLGRVAQALQAAASARPLLADAALLDARRELLRTVTLAGSETGEYALALEAAQEAVRLSATEGVGRRLQATLLLAIVCERVGDSWQAVRLMTPALEQRGADEPVQDVIAAYNGLCATCIGILHRLLDSGADEECRDVLAHHGGKEFVVVFPDMGLAAAMQACERLRACVERHAWPGALPPGRALTISVGLAAAPPYDTTALLQSADQALYRAKRGGRNRIEVAA